MDGIVIFTVYLVQEDVKAVVIKIPVESTSLDPPLPKLCVHQVYNPPTGAVPFA
jgi:hypothetical protein